MHRTQYQNQFDTTQHQQRMHQYAHRQRLAQIASGRPQRPWIGLLLQLLSALFQS